MSQFEINNSESLDQTNSAEEDNFEDINIDCIDCDQEFVWSTGEQLFFRDKGLKNPPKRCKPCKKAKNARIEAINSSSKSGVKQKIEVTVDCAKCGISTTVPFYPSQGRPVYCRSCFLSMNPDVLGKCPE